MRRFTSCQHKLSRHFLNIYAWSCTLYQCRDSAQSSSQHVSFNFNPLPAGLLPLHLHLHEVLIHYDHLTAYQPSVLYNACMSSGMAVVLNTAIWCDSSSSSWSSCWSRSAYCWSATLLAASTAKMTWLPWHGAHHSALLWSSTRGPEVHATKFTKMKTNN